MCLPRDTADALYPETMRYVDVPAVTTSRVSVLGFGAAPVMGRVGRKGSLAALHAAYDAGITFFDTARSYGYGESEALLGEFLAGRRDSVVVCTKFGILPAASGGWKRKLKPLAQAVVRVFPQLRNAARTQAVGQFVPGQFTPEILRTSLEASLRALRTDYVDMLLMHDAPADILSRHDLLDALGHLVEQGKVRMAGISGQHSTIWATIEQRPPVLTTAQFAMDPASFPFSSVTASAQARALFLVGNHPFGGANGVGALRAQVESLRTDPALPAELREKLVGGVSELMPEIVFGCILNGTGISAVTAAMMSLPNLQRNVRAVERCRFTAADLAFLREWLSSRA